MYKGSFIKLTDSALQYLSTLDQNTFYLSLTGMGCSGFQHVLEEYDFEKHDTFYVTADYIDDLTFYIPTSILPQINGLQIDYIEEMLEKRIVFNNPNSSGACGCGNSVSFN